MAQLKRKVTLKQKQGTEPPKKDNKKAWIIGLSLLTVIIIISLLILKNSKDRDSSETTIVVVNDSVNQVGEKETIPKKSSPEGNKEEDNNNNTPLNEGDNADSNETSSDDVESIDEGGNGTINDSEDGSNIKREGTKDDLEGSQADNQPVESEDSSKSEIQIPYKKGVAYRVYQFPFGVDEYTKPDVALDDLARVLTNNPSVEITIFAYTDNVGSVAFNQTLSDKRAKAIADYLIGKGVSESRISYTGMGISNVFENSNKKGRAKNRRAEFKLTEI